MGWWAGVLVMFFSSCSGTQTGVLRVILSRLSRSGPVVADEYTALLDPRCLKWDGDTTLGAVNFY